MGPMVVPFWKHAGMTPADVAFVSTTLGMVASVTGALIGGSLTSHWGLFRALWILGLAQAVSNLGYAAAALTAAGRPGIYAASLCESFTGGLGTAAFLAFMMRVCDKRQAATQYALISALYNLTGTLAGSVSGLGADRWGFGPYFALTFLLALPSYALLPWVKRRLAVPAG
jgi:PAT family beta-lactamase induction signal transducer AmpG